jgi:hypothetical protein
MGDTLEFGPGGKLIRAGVVSQELRPGARSALAGLRRDCQPHGYCGSASGIRLTE